MSAWQGALQRVLSRSAEMQDLYKDSGLLSGLRVLETGHFIAAPFCTWLLGDLGADVIKIELPGGDPVRMWGESINGHALWWSVLGRNKRSVTLNLKSQQARNLVLDLAAKCDVERYVWPWHGQCARCVTGRRGGI